jgi:dolichyl-phosphate-mannose--protein O-mannosyl transferase
MTGYMFKNTCRNVDKTTWKTGFILFSDIPKLTLPILYTATVLILFIMFYPVLTGRPAETWYVQNILRWLPSWQFIH